MSDSEAAKYGRYDGPPSRAEMEKIFLLDNEDMVLIKGHRGAGTSGAASLRNS